VIVYAVVNSFW